MAPKVFLTLIFGCTILALGGCTTKKKKQDGKVTEYSCLTKGLAFDNIKKICKEPDLAFCANNFMILGTGGGNCESPTSQSDCDTIGLALRKTLTWINNNCQGAIDSTATGPDPSIKINWNSESSSIPRGQQSFYVIGRGDVKVPDENIWHNIIVLRKENAVCDLKIDRNQSGVNKFTVQARGTSASICAGTIIVISTQNGSYNVKEFSTRIN